MAQQISPRKPLPAKLCAVPEPSDPSDILRSFTLLRALSLNQLAGQYLRTALAERPQDPDLLLTLSRFEKQQGNVTAALFDATKLVPNYTEYEFSDLPAEIGDCFTQTPTGTSSSGKHERISWTPIS